MVSSAALRQLQLIGQFRSANMVVDSEAQFNEPFNLPTGIVSPSPASTEESVKTPKKSKVLVDYKANDFRGFIFVVHSSYGLLLLQCTRKKNKPLHWQLPGGHIDDPEFEEAARQSSDKKTQLLIAGKIGAARELFEETGIDVRKKLGRLEPASLRTEAKVKHGVELLQNEYNDRLFYLLTVTDDDFATKGVTSVGTDGKHLKVSALQDLRQALFVLLHLVSKSLYTTLELFSLDSRIPLYTVKIVS
jgi:8-oxo-dGTP pyrophosphatase MutT (NUDIX family)